MSSKKKDLLLCAHKDLTIAIPAYLRVMGHDLKYNNFVLLHEACEEIKELRKKVEEEE